VDEQKKIAEAFSRVDAKISIDREIRDKLLLLKKGMMSDLLSGKKQVV
jgi:restriction endonuclease S subunit